MSSESGFFYDGGVYCCLGNLQRKLFIHMLEFGWTLTIVALDSTHFTSTVYPDG